MQITLDPKTEQRIQRELDRGSFRDPGEVVAHALLLLEDPSEDEWLVRNREEIDRSLEVSFAQVQAGQSFTPDEARRLLAERRATRSQ